MYIVSRRFSLRNHFSAGVGDPSAAVKVNGFEVLEACHEYESSEYEIARQHEVAEVACYRPREDTDGVRRPPSKKGRRTPSVFSR